MAVYSLISVFYAALYGFMQYFFIECNNRYHLASVIAGMLEMAAAFFCFRGTADSVRKHSTQGQDGFP